jgi:uncharacterized protein
MFKRQKKRSFWQNLREWVYPRMGWRRFFRYWRHRTLRLPGTPESISRGLACGAAVSFTPFIGFHLLFSFALAWLLRGNLVASAIGTFIGNPFTAFFIWTLIYKVGTWLLHMENNVASLKHFASIVVKHPDKILDVWPQVFTPILLPMMIGCLPVALFVWAVTYAISRGLIAEYRILRKAHLQHKQQSRKHLA